MEPITRYFYLRSPAGHPTGLIALLRDGDSVQIAASFCNPKDRWNKQRAHTIVDGRLAEGRRKSCIAFTIDKLDEIDLNYVIAYFGTSVECSDVDRGRFENAKSFLIPKEESLSDLFFHSCQYSCQDAIPYQDSAKVPGETEITEQHFFFRDWDKKPVGVVAMKRFPTGVRVAASFCSPKDEWDRDTGVKIAKERLESEKSSLPDRKRGRNLTVRDLILAYNASVTIANLDTFDYELQRFVRISAPVQNGRALHNPNYSFYDMLWTICLGASC